MPLLFTFRYFYNEDGFARENGMVEVLAVMEAVLRLYSPVSGVFVIPLDRLLRVYLILALSGILCLCARRYVQSGNVTEAEGKEVPVRMAGTAGDTGVADNCCGMKIHAAVLMEEGIGGEQIGSRIAPQPVPSKRMETAARGAAAAAADETEGVKQTAVPDMAKPLPDMGRDLPQEIPSITVTPVIPEHGSAGDPVKHPDSSSTFEPAAGEENPPAGEDTGFREYAGFLIDEEGYITGCMPDMSYVDGIFVIAVCEGCTGIRKDAFQNLDGDIMEIFVPANITDIEPGAFDSLPNLFYIETAADNPVYYSKDGVLYTYSQDAVVFCPSGR